MDGDPRAAQIRPREAGDVPALAAVLIAQQPATGYPLRNPLPFPPEQFVARERDVAAWVALLDDAPVGHVAVTRLVDDAVGRAFGAASGMPLERLGCVSTLFVAPGAGGRGVGGRLLDAAEGWCRTEGLVPVLDVFPSHAGARDLYLRRGWVEIGTTRLDWVPEDGPDIALMMLPDPR
ncbi:hypothetical protein SGUI_0449 [Serinicoccus hydrothermalis]|uniref:N-acetyltransferase domain-containing protein n=1 Tax=Serinicoccus hydrothermalis TaxID=1758689 RepID=A0A1B1N8Y9_9MICO|nr:GNAT family N-acetyltransferase [Serinicoccus hydrothermalis]ANS77845.1 hypothetical protein SGUI_0449 [Serinicoccus hydrothermalis]